MGSFACACSCRPNLSSVARFPLLVNLVCLMPPIGERRPTLGLARGRRRFQKAAGREPVRESLI